MKEELNTHNLNKIIVDHRCKWTQHSSRMNNKCILKLVYEYTPTGRNSVCHPMKRWIEQHKQESFYPVADELINMCYKFYSSDSSVICPES
jgi:hypothetical protein